MKSFFMTTFLAEQKRRCINASTQSYRTTFRALITFSILAVLSLSVPHVTPQSFAATQESPNVLNGNLYRMPIPIQLQLVAHTQRYVNSIAKNVIPNPKSKNVVKRGNEYVARYLVIDTSSATMEALPFEKGKTYKAIITYHELEYQCCGATKDAALKGNFSHAKTRRLIEVLQYRQGRWR